MTKKQLDWIKYKYLSIGCLVGSGIMLLMYFLLKYPK